MTTAEDDVTGPAEQYRRSSEAAQPALGGVPAPVAVGTMLARYSDVLRRAAETVCGRVLAAHRDRGGAG